MNVAKKEETPANYITPKVSKSPNPLEKYMQQKVIPSNVKKAVKNCCHISVKVNMRVCRAEKK